MPTERAQVLAIDDRPEVLRLVARTLGERYACDLADGVAEARALLESGSYELVLCDIQMPGESGLVLIEEIAERWPRTAVVMVTGVDDPETAERALELGAHGYLVKPFWPGQLLITVKTALRRRELELAQEAHARTLEERLQLLMDKAPVPIYIKDREFRYLIANRVAHEYVGVGPGELIGRTDEEVVSPESAQRTRETDLEVLERGRPLELELEIEFESGPRCFLVAKFPYVDDTGAIVGISGIATDITAQRQAERLQGALAEQRRHSIEELRRSRRETVEKLAEAIEMRDRSTGAHVNRMAEVTAMIGEKLGLDPERLELLRVAAPLHDIGKIAIPDEILRKPGPLTAEERRLMEKHTTFGYELLHDHANALLDMAAAIALTHQEWFDGSGYPRGIAGEEIPLEGRIVAVADVFDALLSDRVYRPGLTREEAISIIREERGTHFDPLVADALLDNPAEAFARREGLAGQIQ
jgi:PAS domain S-box-containing protein